MFADCTERDVGVVPDQASLENRLSRRSALPGVRAIAKRAPKPRRRDRLEAYATLGAGNARIGRQQSTIGILPVADGAARLSSPKSSPYPITQTGYSSSRENLLSFELLATQTLPFLAGLNDY